MSEGGWRGELLIKWVAKFEMGEGGREMVGRYVKARVGWKTQVSQRAGEMIN